MMGHNICFKGVIWKFNPNLSLLPLLIQSTTAENSDLNLIYRICYKKCTIYFRHINEDRRKTESQVVMFDIMNDIEDCPVSALPLCSAQIFYSSSSAPPPPNPNLDLSY